MARGCPFCGRRASTKEHLWGDAITRRLEMKPEFTIVVRHGQGAPATGHIKDETVPHTWQSNAIAATVSVCRDRNNHWMSDLEEACGDYVVAMALGQHKLIPREMCRLLAVYALKSAVTHEAAHAKYLSQPIVPREDAQRLAETQELSPRASVSLYAYRGERTGIARFMPPLLYPRRPPRDPLQGFQVTLGLGHLVFQVLGFSGPRDSPLLPKRVSSDYRTQIWPAADSIAAVLWPPRWVLNDHGVEDLATRGSWFDPSLVQWSAADGLGNVDR